MRRPIVFLHLPKTGGQTIHHAVASTFAPEERSPIRVMSEVGPEGPFPSGYLFHSGHLDWRRLNEVGGDPFVFTVLRDPRERLGSFYFYMRATLERRAQDLGREALTSHQAAMLGPAETFFFPEDDAARRRIRQTWVNVTSNFFAFRSLSRAPRHLDISRGDLLAQALANAGAMTAIYRFGDFEPLEDDMEHLTGQRLRIAEKRSNTGPLDARVSRWQALLDLFEDDRNRRRLEEFVEVDQDLMERLAFRQSTLSGSGP
ncbi:sulfotransferase family 2 domain-containing protein [Histidinibacterium lentulum]|nr:sulfotransferase family 2 domain-containing protein [Histidinibacterium lentulum]